MDHSHLHLLDTTNLNGGNITTNHHGGNQLPSDFCSTPEYNNHHGPFHHDGTTNHDGTNMAGGLLIYKDLHHKYDHCFDPSYRFNQPVPLNPNGQNIDFTTMPVGDFKFGGLPSFNNGAML